MKIGKGGCIGRCSKKHSSFVDKNLRFEMLAAAATFPIKSDCYVKPFGKITFLTSKTFLKALPTFRCIFSSREQIKIECFCLCFMSANGAMEREANINTGWRYDDSPRWYFLCFKWPKWITLLEGDVDPLSVKAISCCVHVLQKLWWSRL